MNRRDYLFKLGIITFCLGGSFLITNGLAWSYTNGDTGLEDMLKACFPNATTDFSQFAGPCNNETLSEALNMTLNVSADCLGLLIATCKLSNAQGFNQFNVLASSIATATSALFTGFNAYFKCKEKASPKKEDYLELN